MTEESMPEEQNEPEGSERFRSLPERVAPEDLSAAHESQPPGEPPITDGDLQRNVLLFGAGG